ncbi:MAG: hypothetical protein RLY78_1134 [Pseudomonadota bacterium]|uniref:Cupin domain-containing protein n=1 Tax=Pseudaquabacterium rugosum TaxID=2984194 RepID=A0ABU9BD19_9BURK
MTEPAPLQASAPFFHSSEQPWVDAAPGIRRQILGHTRHVMGVAVRFEQGAGVGSAHAHALHDQVVLITAGRFDVRVGDERRVLVAGDAFVAPRDVMHEAIALDPDSCLVDMFSPRRDDFL